MKVGYYPGCSLESTAKEFDLSFRAICKGYGIDLVDIPDWNCCGASAAHQLSEELATFVGREGALSFLRDRYGEDSEDYRQALASLSDWNRYRDRVLELYDELDTLYRSETDSQRISAEKQRIVEDFNQRLRSEAEELFQSDRFHSFEGIPVNNAYILSFVRYSQDLDIFYRLYKARGGDLKATVEVLIQIRQVKGSQRVPAAA